MYYGTFYNINHFKILHYKEPFTFICFFYNTPYICSTTGFPIYKFTYIYIGPASWDCHLLWWCNVLLHHQLLHQFVPASWHCHFMWWCNIVLHNHLLWYLAVDRWNSRELCGCNLIILVELLCILACVYPVLWTQSMDYLDYLEYLKVYILIMGLV